MAAVNVVYLMLVNEGELRQYHKLPFRDRRGQWFLQSLSVICGIQLSYLYIPTLTCGLSLVNADAYPLHDALY
jgi:hypothetical protein